MGENFINLKQLMDRLLRHPLLNSISFEAVVDYTIDFLRIVQCAGFFRDKCAYIEINDYVGSLPDDFYELYQVRLAAKDKENNIFSSTSIRVKPAFNTFHNSEDKYDVDYTYKLQGGCIHTSMREGYVEISYKAVIVDEDGYPMIPDNSKFLRALEAYIKKQWFTILFDLGKLQNAILQNAQQEYAFAVGACENEYHKVTLDRAESFYNTWRTLIAVDYEAQRNFIGIGHKQNIKYD